MKKLLSILIGFLLCCQFLAAQNSKPIECGTGMSFSKRVPVAEPKYYDMYGNAYSEGELIPQKTTTHCDNLTKFKLNFSDDVTSFDKEIICDVFKYLEDEVFLDNPLTKIQIEIRYNYPFSFDPNEQMPTSVAADALPFYADRDCSPAFPVPFLTMLGDVSHSKVNGGRIRLNTAYKNQWNHSPHAPTPSGTWVDLYSVALHEAMHLMGFASRLKPDTKLPTKLASGAKFSNWDQYLFDNANKQPLITDISTDHCCPNHEFNKSATSPMNQSCNSQISFSDKNGNSLASLSCHNLSIGALSHINDCVGNKEFVMNTSITQNQTKRVLLKEELQILCTLGYTIKTPQGEKCSTNAFLAIEDCDTKIYTLKDNKGQFNVLDNDLKQANYLFKVTNYNKQGLSLIISKNGLLEYTIKQKGEWIVEYEISDDKGISCSKASLKIVCIDEELGNCCPEKQCFVSCLGDFEQFKSNFELRHYVTNVTDFCDQNPFTFKSGGVFAVNTVDLLTDGSTYIDYCDDDKIKQSPPPNTFGGTVQNINYAAFWSGPGDTEAFVLPLCKTVPKASSAKITFYARVNKGCDANEPNIYMCFLPDNPSSASIVFPTIFQAKVLIKGDDWTKYEINIPYTSTKPSNSLLIYGETKVLTGYVYFNIDDIVVTIPPDAEFTSAVACPKLTLIPSNQNGLHTWTVTDASGQTVATTNTPTANFNNLLNGTYTVKHTVKDDECGEGVVSKTVKISCTECGCNFDKAITIVADPNGTNYSQLGYPITLGDAQHNGCISITGKLIIDENVTIFNCGNIIMDACSEIEILKGKTLTLNNNTISGCKKMWKGISVLDGGKLFMYDNTVRDAQWAVNATPTVYKNVLSFVNATRIIIKGNNFDKNYIGVNIIGRDGVANLIRQTPFTDNSFKGNDGVTNLLPLCTPGLPKYSATHGFAGIVIKNLPSFQVGASTDKYLTNTFSNLQNGILATNSKVSVNWAEFNTLVSEWTSESVNPTATTATGIAVLADKGTALVNKCEINKCGHGVYGIAAELTVTNNNMPEVYRGVEAVNSLIFNVSDNKNIYYRNRGIIARQLSYAASANYKILNNTI